ncbi:MAG: hypothetical protein AAFU79_27930, partial [Myxococcota bacterium]
AASAAALLALAATKGARLHVRSGRVYAFGMIVASLSALTFAAIRFSPPVLFDSLLMLYALSTALLAHQAPSAAVRFLETLFTGVGVLATLALTAAGVAFATQGSLNVVPAGLHALIFGSLVVGDFRFRRRDRATERHHRHLVRMAWAVAIGAYAPLFTFREVFGLGSMTVYFVGMSLGPIILLAFRSQALSLAAATPKPRVP